MSKQNIQYEMSDVVETMSLKLAQSSTGEAHLVAQNKALHKEIERLTGVIAELKESKGKSK